MSPPFDLGGRVVTPSRIYELTLHDFKDVQRISASSPAQARYRSWQHAVDAGYKISLVEFGKLVKSVRLWNPISSDRQNSMTISEDGVREAVRSVLAANHPGYFLDTIEACVRAVKAQAEQEAETPPMSDLKELARKRNDARQKVVDWMAAEGAQGPRPFVNEHVGVVPLSDLPGGLRGGISFDRLIRVLREAGEVAQSEVVTHLAITPEGITYRVECPDRPALVAV